MPSSVYLNSLQCSRTRAPIAEDFGCASVSAGRREGSAGWLRCISMEFIRHIGELHCSKCERVESDRNIYYAQDGDTQLYGFVCGRCGHWTRLAFGYEEIGPLAPGIRRRNPKVRRFEERNEVERYGTNWG